MANPWSDGYRNRTHPLNKKRGRKTVKDQYELINFGDGTYGVFNNSTQNYVAGYESTKSKSAAKKKAKDMNDAAAAKRAEGKD